MNKATEDRSVELSIVPEDLGSISLEPLEEAISEYISEKTGFCHKGFSYKIVVETVLDTED